MAGFTMTEADRKRLRVNRVNLVKNMILGEEFFSVMREDKVFTADLQEEVMSGVTKGDKAGRFLDVLVRRGPKAFETFIKALVVSSQEDLANMLSQDLCEKHIRLQKMDEEDPEMDGNLMDVTDNSTKIEKEITTEEILDDLEDEDCIVVNVKAMTESKKADLHKQEPNRVYPLRTPHGRAIIINMHYFTKASFKNRDGTEYDTENLQTLFKSLQFETVVHENKSGAEIWDIVKKEKTLHNSIEGMKYSAFILCILSHGEKNKVIGSDGEAVDIDAIITQFDGKNCHGLLEKPKIFFIQACQGNASTKGVISSVNFENFSGPIPSKSDSVVSSNECDAGPIEGRSSVHEKADIFIALSSVAGYVSWRNSQKGSWFIRSLVYILSRFSHSYDLEKMMTKVFDVISRHKATDGFLQMPEKKSTLRKEFYFRPS